MKRALCSLGLWLFSLPLDASIAQRCPGDRPPEGTVNCSLAVAGGELVFQAPYSLQDQSIILRYSGNAPGQVVFRGRGMMWPADRAFAPDGNLVAFVSSGDLWMMNLATGELDRFHSNVGRWIDGRLTLRSKRRLYVYKGGGESKDRDRFGNPIFEKPDLFVYDAVSKDAFTLVPQLEHCPRKGNHVWTLPEVFGGDSLVAYGEGRNWLVTLREAGAPIAAATEIRDLCLDEKRFQKIAGDAAIHLVAYGREVETQEQLLRVERANGGVRSVIPGELTAVRFLSQTPRAIFLRVSGKSSHGSPVLAPSIVDLATYRQVPLLADLADVYRDYTIAPDEKTATFETATRRFTIDLQTYQVTISDKPRKNR